MVDDTTDKDAVGTVAFAYEMGVLKRLRRAGWWHAGVRDPESVAEHSLRVAQLAALIAAEEGGDPGRAAYLGMWHDSQETRIGDIPHSARPYVDVAPNERITEDQVVGLPDNAAKSIREAVTEYETQETLEARCAKDADRLECLMQAVEYRESGYTRVDGWIESSRAKIQTPFGQRLAEAALTVSPLTWRNR
ncbi:HD domain-containing protein [Kribbella solani]|uniref:HD domain-containing protein n=1 Tax=Kribbella solani TaxID=236067 RepID=UPI0029A21E37|nr:HD domain-containing protein [Kribbella solani]MDX3002672.1 HD domain-containing protein [Kribbella solani]